MPVSILDSQLKAEIPVTKRAFGERLGDLAPN